MMKSILRAVKNVFGGNRKSPVSSWPFRRTVLNLEQLEARDCPAVYTVSGLGDAGVATALFAGDLRWCMTQANSDRTQDTIQFAEGLTGTITIDSQLPTITDPLIINGPGAANLTIERNTNAQTAQFRLMAITANCTIVGLTFTNGNTANNGGAISNSGTLGISDCIFTANYATTGDGGAIFNSVNAFLSVTDSTFTYNEAQYGGAIYDNGESEITGCTIYQNEASVDAGAIYVGGTSTLIGGGTDINENLSTRDGGGILIGTNAYLEINWAQIRFNLAGRNGGGIYVHGSVLAQDANFELNEAGDMGGGLYLTESGAAALDDDVVIQYNSAPNGGDGISYDDEESTLISYAVLIDDTIEAR